jgi:Histidine kinase-, DNA gyrase B-, and HSP90-like ATPase
MTEQVRTIDLTPSPRVLLMLGQIEFAAWQCLAELIDNSIDGFTSAPGGALTTANPVVTIELPMGAQVDQGKGAIVVADNGPGMSLTALEKAMRAGYSGNSATDKLGLFGMGFNVATARLGRLTEVRTTRIEDDNWAVLTIDLDRMRQENTFHAPVRTERKREEELGTHGTRVLISRLDATRARYLASGGGRSTVRAKLSRVYGHLVRERGVQIFLGGAAEAIPGYRFCTWSKERSVKLDELGEVRAIQVIDEDLGKRPFCDNCWQYLLIDGPCPTCGADGKVVMRPRRVRGWIGVQRFFHPTDYGIDLVRNGRVIEAASKSFFSWRDPNTDELIVEYPLEQTHWGGRFVGELEIDFVPLASHQKDAFEKGTSEWKDVMRVVRGDDGPILEGKRKALAYPEVDLSAPMVRLHKAFRRGHPAGLRTLVPGGADGKGFNELAKDWADRFYSGDAEYQSDSRWWAAVVEAEKAHEKKRGAKVPTELQPDDILGTEDTWQEEAGGEAQVPRIPEETLQKRESEFVPALSGEFVVPGLDDCVPVRLETYRLLKGNLRNGAPIEVGFVAGKGEAMFDPEHRLFTQTLLEPVDLIVPEIVYQLWQRNTLQGSGRTLGELALAVRGQLPGGDTTTRDAVAQAASAVLTEVRAHLGSRWNNRAAEASRRLPSHARDVALGAMQRSGLAVENDVEAALRSEDFPQYLPWSALALLVGEEPQLLFDGTFLAPDAAAVREDVRSGFGLELEGLITDLGGATSAEANGTRGELGRARLMRAVAALALFDARRAGA